jgi:subtilisin family serine protease
MKYSRIIALAVVLSGTLAACVADSTSPRSPAPQSFSTTGGGSTSYLILGKGNKLPSDIAASITAAGGTLTANVDKVGIAVATSDAADFQAKAGAIAGIESVAEDRVIPWTDPSERVYDAGDAGAQVDLNASSIGDNETFFNVQWGPKAVHAPAAWDLGARGTGVRVAVLDGGLNNTHIDLNGSVDVAHSASFVPGFAFNQDVAGFSHATHVAGIIAARDNSVGTIGIAPGATIIGVKVLQNGSGSFGAVIQGIVYASTSIAQGGAGADIINMSLGAVFDRQGKDAAQLANALSRATMYAVQQGTTVIVAAGNNAADLDHTNNLISVPAQSTGAIAIAATGPVGFALGATNFTRPASYTNFGQSAIDFGAPGGDGVLPGNAVCAIPAIPAGLVIAPCWVFDLVISPGSIPSNTGYFFAAGTSMAAPHAAGVAALIIEHAGGSGRLNPAQVEAALRKSADDLGKPGNDDFYGAGFVNALRAVQ